jgi:DNA-binding transcriptional LysR family regulator
LKLRDLLDVRVICETGSLRKAAEVLGVTQPTLSNRIAHLEDQIGAPLFDRSRGRSEPTDLALFIASRASAMADEADRLSREVVRLSSGQAGLVRVGVGPALIRVVAARIVRCIQDRHPEVSVELVSGHPRQLAESLVRRELDVLVCDFPDLTHDALVAEPMFESEMVAVARPDHPLCAAAPSELAAVLQYPLAVPHFTPQWTDVLLRRYGLDLNLLPGRVVCSDFETLVRVVVASPKLITFGPRFGFAPELDSGSLAVIDVALPLGTSVGLYTTRDAFPLPAVTKAQDAIREICAEFRGDLR